MSYTLTNIFNALLRCYGTQHWWPADSPFEVMVGAVLTQNTSWNNVERAIIALKENEILDAKTLLQAKEKDLASWIRPAGYFNVKAKSLRNVCQWIVEQNEFPDISHYSTVSLRDALLSINGVGPETADDILLYAFERPVFVVDSYTRRIFSRVGLIEENWHYEHLRGWFQTHLMGANTDLDTVQLFNEYHALIVNHAKIFCKRKPVCEQCCIVEHCQRGQEEISL